MQFTVSETWQAAYPCASVGVLAMRQVANPQRHPDLEARKAALQEQLRSRYADFDRHALQDLPTVQAYAAYYRRFKKTYHVLHQIESVALKGKSIPRVAALVEAMFMAELDNLLLTAGHDLDALQPPVGIDVADGRERYVCLNGKEKTLKPDDMFIADAAGVISSIIYGPDRRTQITPDTRNALFTVYAPAGIESEAVRSHLQDIQSHAQRIAREAETILLDVYETS
ncbi:MAG TPA: hypothetical protein ENN19_04715 [Chloroflexi bacterium]|nr:hypothetical protein [Chloroflexota bacterium]